MRIKKAVITAAGWGTRFLPLTKCQPKEMLPLLDKPLIQYSVEEAVACGIDLVVIVISPGKEAIQRHFGRSVDLEEMLERRGQVELAEDIRRLSTMADIIYVEQRERLGLGHAVLMAKNVIGQESFALLLPDDLFEQGEAVLKSMIAAHDEYHGSVVAVKRVGEDEVGRYGIIDGKKICDRIYRVKDLVEKPRPSEAPSDLAIMGRYVLAPDIFRALEDTAPGHGGEIQLTDALRRLSSESDILAYEFGGERYDAGTPLGWLQTTLAVALRDPDIGPGLIRYLDALSAQRVL